jgi:hypothetical protein
LRTIAALWRSSTRLPGGFARRRFSPAVDHYFRLLSGWIFILHGIASYWER